LFKHVSHPHHRQAKGRSDIEPIYQIRNWLAGTYTLRILEDFFELWWKILPYIIISIGLNVAGARYVRHKTLLHPASSESLSIILAALIGLASPLPTYAAVPIGLSLMVTGLPFSAVMAFILASPLMNPTIFFLTATQIGMGMAIARTVSAFVLAVVGGMLTAKVFTRLFQEQPGMVSLRNSAEKTLMQDILANSKYILKFFSIALLLSAAVRALIPPETISGLLGGDGKVSTLVAIGMGVPFYTCGGSAIPFVETLMKLGMQKGPMLAFFIAGPATKLETLYAYRSQLGMRVLAFYLALTLVFSYVAGMVYSAF
jgi:uncharacterized membrane protein YraQ (UPF0718 family)